MTRDLALSAKSPHPLAPLMAEAEVLAKSALIPEPLRGKPADVAVVLLTGRELGLSGMQALRSIHVVKGRSVLSADLLMALVVQRTDVCTYFTPTSLTSEGATYETLRVGAPKPVTFSFTMEDARRAKLTGNPTWTQYPGAMCRARCVAALARAVYPDLTAGVYVAGEIPDEEPAPRKRRTATLELPEESYTEKLQRMDPNHPHVKMDPNDDLPGALGMTPLEKWAVRVAEAASHDALETLMKTAEGELDEAAFATLRAQAVVRWKELPGGQ